MSHDFAFDSDHKELPEHISTSIVSSYESIRNGEVHHSQADDDVETTRRCDMHKIRKFHTSTNRKMPVATAAAASVAVLFALGALGTISTFLNPLSSLSICNPEISPLHYLKMLTIPAVMAAIFLACELYRFVKGAMVYTEQKKSAKRTAYLIDNPGSSIQAFKLEPHEEFSDLCSGLYQLATSTLIWGNVVAAACAHFQHMLGVATDWSTLFYSMITAFTLLVSIVGLVHKWPHSAWDIGLETDRRDDHETHKTRLMVSVFNPVGLVIAFLTQAIQVAFSYIPTNGNTFHEQCVLLLRVASVVLSAIFVPEFAAAILGLKNCGVRKPQTCKDGISILPHIIEKLKAALALQGLFHFMQAIALHPDWGQSDVSDFELSLDGNYSCVPWNAAANQSALSTTAAASSFSTAVPANGTIPAGLDLNETLIELAKYVAAATLLTLGCYAQHRLTVGYRKIQPEDKSTSACSCLTTSPSKINSRATTTVGEFTAVCDNGEFTEDDNPFTRSSDQGLL